MVAAPLSYPGLTLSLPEILDPPQVTSQVSVEAGEIDVTESVMFTVQDITVYKCSQKSNVFGNWLFPVFANKKQVVRLRYINL